MPDVTEDRLRALEIQSAQILLLLQELSTKMGDRITATDIWRTQVDRILMGDGNGQKGHNIRIDRLEQAAAHQKWMLRSIVIPVLLLAAKAVFDFLAR